MENAVLKRTAFFISLFVQKSPSFGPEKFADTEIEWNDMTNPRAIRCYEKCRENDDLKPFPLISD